MNDSNDSATNTPPAGMSRQRKMALFITLLVLAIAGVVAIICMMLTTPQRTIDQFMTAVQNHDQAAALSQVSTDIKPYKRENIQYFIEDWTGSTTLSMNKTTDASWRERIRQEKNEAGDMVDKMNQHGDRDKELKPAPRYWAHFYDADVTVQYDDTEDPVTIVLRRKTDNSWSPFAQMFRGWEIVQIKYQPLPTQTIEQLDQADQPTSDPNSDVQQFAPEDNVEIDADGNIIINGPGAGDTVPADSNEDAGIAE